MERYEQAVQQWQNWNVQTVADIDQYLDNFRILFAYHSGKIEMPKSPIMTRAKFLKTVR